MLDLCQNALIFKATLNFVPEGLYGAMFDFADVTENGILCWPSFNSTFVHWQLLFKGYTERIVLTTENRKPGTDGKICCY